MQAILRHINFDGTAVVLTVTCTPVHAHFFSSFISLIYFSLHKLLFCFSFVVSFPLLQSVVKSILVASPGFVKDQFIAYLFKEAVRQDNKILLENRPKFMLVHSSSGHKYSLKGTEMVNSENKMIISSYLTCLMLGLLVFFLFCRNPV